MRHKAARIGGRRHGSPEFLRCPPISFPKYDSQNSTFKFYEKKEPKMIGGLRKFRSNFVETARSLELFSRRIGLFLFN